MPVAESKDALQAKWWNGWWAQDFSWAGLADKPVGQGVITIHGGRHGEQDLQAYWRRDPVSGTLRDEAMLEAAGELLRAPDGKFWHLAHVPLNWRDGSPAKAGWDADRVAMLGGLVAARVAAGCATTVGKLGHERGPDGRAQLAGAVLLAPPPHPPATDSALHVVADWAWLPAWHARGASFGPGFLCRNVFFSEYARFDGATFSGDANFDSATFSGYARFVSATFSGDASFDGAIFSGYARFNSATFSGYASFDSATFSGYAIFVSATFSGYARFDIATFSGIARFDGATFSRNTRFQNGEFAATASFQSAKFLPAAASSRWRNGVSFRGRRFNAEAKFDRATFSVAMDFSAAVFARLTSFAHIIWPDDARHWHRAFDQAVFEDVVSFQGAGFRCFAAFDGATFEGGLQLDEMEETAAAARFTRELRAAIDLPAEETGPGAASAPAPLRGGWPGFQDIVQRDIALAETEAARERAAQIRLKQLERGCRVLKQAMDKASDKTREQMFFASELIARRKQTATPPWERAFSWLYEKTADYGRSIARPLVALLASIPVFALLYWGISGGLSGNWAWPAFWEAMNFSARRVLPFGAWEATEAQLPKLLLGDGNTLFTVVMRALATLQSIFALAMAFLAGLALRRRFQIT